MCLLLCVYKEMRYLFRLASLMAMVHLLYNSTSLVASLVPFFLCEYGLQSCEGLTFILIYTKG